VFREQLLEVKDKKRLRFLERDICREQVEKERYGAAYYLDFSKAFFSP
jgi:hypothetical protein